MHLLADRKGNITEENSIQDRFLEKLYLSAIGRIALRFMISPLFSKIGGKILDSGLSKILIYPFIKKHSIRLSEYEKKRYNSYNDFFTRKMLLGARHINRKNNIFISPCDSRLSVYKIDEKNMFSIKNTKYTAESLLRNKKLAKSFCGGYIWIFRLCVEDYHHYIYTDKGKVSENFKISGVFHTVNPVANDNYPIYKENTREYCVIQSENFGKMIQMEVGALLVGKIKNRPCGKLIYRGQERGYFAFGGSTIILMTQRGKARPDTDILKNSKNGIETIVKLGEHVGIKQED